jgi:hypothetical protein
MGYTHYWRCAPTLPSEMFNAVASDCQKALMQAGVPLAGPARTDCPG